MKKVSFWLPCFIIIVLISIAVICYCLEYFVLIYHDLKIPYDRNFFNPEHGRYFGTYASYIFTDVLPTLFKIHPNDFQLTVVNPVKAVLTVFSFIIIADGAFLFSKKKYSVINIPFSNPAFILTYVVVFLALFNENFFSGAMEYYFMCFENEVFFEYAMTIWVYVVFTNIVLFALVKNNIPQGRDYTVLLVFAFLLGITIETINAPVFVGLGLFSLYLLKQYFKYKKILPAEELKENTKKIAGIYGIFLLSYFLYYINGNDHTFDYQGSIPDYLINHFVPFTKIYIKSFLCYHSLLLIPIIVLLLGSFYINRENRSQVKIFTIYTVCSLLGFLILFAAFFFLGVGYSGYWVQEDRLVNLYKYVCLYHLLVTFSFIIDNKYSEKASKIIKIVICALVLCIFHQNFILNYHNSIKTARALSKDIRTAAYKSEKYAVSGNSPELILPKELEKYDAYLWYSEPEFSNYAQFIHNVYPKRERIKSYKFEDRDDIIFTKKELTELNFTKLIELRENMEFVPSDEE